MPNELPLPPDLHHLIEKRESGERRKAERRQKPATLNRSTTMGTDDEAMDEPIEVPEQDDRIQGERCRAKRREGDK